MAVRRVYTPFVLRQFYEERVLPRLIHAACGGEEIERQRARVVPRARGTVVEIGFGSGLNLAHYDPARVERIWAVEPSPGMRRMAGTRRGAGAPEVTLLGASAEAIPLDSASADTVVLTFTLCSIPRPDRALAEMRRVLRPGGMLLFCEHGEAPDPPVQRWQQRLTPLWSKIGGGCHLDRPIGRLLEQGRFELEDLEQGYLPRMPRFAGYHYWGRALPG